MEDTSLWQSWNNIERLPSVVRASVRKKKIDFLVAGSQKSGTSALIDYLKIHPQICLPVDRKEIHFFDNEFLFRLPYLKYSYYHSFFLGQDTRLTWGEGTPEYMFWEASMRRIWEYNPQMKIIVILRSPIDRAFSHWNMMIARGLETLSFEDAIQMEATRCRDSLPFQHRFYSYLSRGLYTEQLRRIWRFFPHKQTLILRNRELRYQSEKTLKRVTDFLSIDSFSNFEERPIRAKKKKSQMTDQARSYLTDYFKHDILNLEHLMGWDCSDWY